MFQKLPLGHDSAKQYHKDLIKDANAYSLTITLNPQYNHKPVHEQYNGFSRQLRQLFAREMDGLYKDLIISYEFTKDFNIHAHAYLITSVPLESFEQNFKYYKQKYPYIGKNYKYKKIDSVTEELENYPFKDIERTQKYSEIQNCLFKPTHDLRSTSTVGQLHATKTGNIDISKFLKHIKELNLLFEENKINLDS